MNAWLAWSGWGAVLVAIGFLNPSLSHPLLDILVFPDIWKTLIREYQSPLTLDYDFSFYLLVLIALTTLFMAVQQSKWDYLVCGGVLLYAGMSMFRMVTPSGIIFLVMFAHLLSNAKGRNRLNSLTSVQLRLVLLASLTTVLIPMWESIAFARAAMFSNQNYRYLFPEYLVSYMIENNKSGKIFNVYRTGGYLINRLSPESQVYIDGRTGILYPPRHFLKYKEALMNSSVLKEEIEKYGIDFAILESTPKFARTVIGTGALELDFVDVNYALYSRGSAGLPSTGNLWARPYCWASNQSLALDREWQTVRHKLHIAAPVRPLLALATSYTTSKDQKNWLSSLAPENMWNDESKRFIAFRALDHGLNDLAIKIFNSISEREVKDHLATVLAYQLNGDYQLAEKILNLVSRQNWPEIEFNDLVIMQALLVEIQQENPLKYMDQSFVDSIFDQVGRFALSGKQEIVTVSSFCAN